MQELLLFLHPRNIERGQKERREKVRMWWCVPGLWYRVSLCTLFTLFCVRTFVCRINVQFYVQCEYHATIANKGGR